MILNDNGKNIACFIGEKPPDPAELGKKLVELKITQGTPADKLEN